MEEVEVWQWVVGQLIVGAAIWGALHANMKNMTRRMDELHKTVENGLKALQTRIDSLFSDKDIK